MLHALFALSGPATAAAQPLCLGEFIPCSTTGACVLDASQCGDCGRGQYRCPLSKACVASAADYPSCPGLKGTHLDASLDDEARLD